MKKSYPGKTIRIYQEDGTYFSVIPKDIFLELNEKGYTRKKARELGIGSRLWNNSYSLYVKNDNIRVDKIKTTNAINRLKQWDESLNKLEVISPGITKLFRDNLKDNPEVLTQELEKLNDLFHEMKIFTRQSKKYIRQSCERKGVPYIKFVANTSEYKLKKILKDLGCEIEVQPYINKLWYDFRVNNFLIELDGESYHTTEKDEYKEKVAKENGYQLLRINTKELSDEVSLIKKIKKCLLGVK